MIGDLICNLFEYHKQYFLERLLRSFLFQWSKLLFSKIDMSTIEKNYNYKLVSFQYSTVNNGSVLHSPEY